MKQVMTNIEDAEYELFQRTAAGIGITTDEALRIFIYAFNEHHGFPFPAHDKVMQIEAFETEEEATRFATDLAMETVTKSINH